MSQEEILKNKLIKKILSISNLDVLQSLEKIISSSASKEYAENENIELTPEQLEMIRLAEEDIKYGRVISHEDLKKESLEWLESKNRIK